MHIMMRARYIFAMLTLTWVASQSVVYFPGLWNWSSLIDLGCVLAVIVAVIAALISKKWSALGTCSLLLVGLVVAADGLFAYQLNNVCSPGDHVIQSEGEAIKQAQIRIIRARYGSHGVPGYIDEKPGYADFGKTENCCEAAKSRNIYGVIVWEVFLHGQTIDEPKVRNVSAQMSLSNCGAVFIDDSFIEAVPQK
jgi:hypothetical protein